MTDAPKVPDPPRGGTSIRRKPGTQPPGPSPVKPERATGVRKRNTVETPAPKSRAPLFIGLGVAAVVLIGAAAYFGTRKAAVEEKVVTKPSPTAVAPKPTVAPSPSPTPTPSPTAEPTPSPKPKPSPIPLPADPPPSPAEREAFLARLAEVRKEGVEKVARVRAELTRDMEEEKKADAKFAKRFDGLRKTVLLVSGSRHADALVIGFSLDNLTLETEKGKPTVAVAWNLVSAESTREIANHVYRAATGQDKFDLSRFYILRRMWKDAQASLEEAKKLDDSLGSKVDEILDTLKPLVSGGGGFHASLRVIPPDGVVVTFDLKDASQTEDWAAQKKEAGEMTVEKAQMKLAAKDRALWALSSLEFVNDVDVDTTIRGDGALLLQFHKNYELRADANGFFLRRKGGDDILAKNEGAKLSATAQKVRLSVRKRKFSAFLADKEVLTFEAEAPKSGKDPRGPLMIGVSQGSITFDGPFVVGGRLEPAEMEKRFATMEMLVQRAINPEIEEIDAMRERRSLQSMLGTREENLALSADGFFEFYVRPKLSMDDVTNYNQLKRKLAGGETRDSRKKIRKEIDKLIADHPDFPQGWYLRGSFLLRFEADLSGARSDIQKAIELFPEFHEAHVMLGKSWDYAREFEKAKVCAEKALELKPDSESAWFLLADMRFAIDKSSSVRAEFETRLASQLGADGFEVNQQRRWIQVQSKGPRDLGALHEYETTHYRIITDISDARARWYGDRLEIVRAYFENRFKSWFKGDNRPKPRIAIFNAREAFYTYSELSSTERHENALGFFAPNNNELVLFEDLDMRETEETLYHEAFHHFASSFLKYPPYWWNEGIAEYMSAVRIEGGKIIEDARVLKGRLQNLMDGLSMQEAMSGFKKKAKEDVPKEHQEDEELDELLESMTRFIFPFEQIMTQTPGQFYRGQVGMKYAQAWTMVHFFYEFEKGKYRTFIERYLTVLVEGKTQREAFDEVFKGHTDDMEREWNTYVKSLKPPKTP